MERWEIVVVGAGAAGWMAALTAGKTMRGQGKPGKVLLLEGNPKPGKKLLATGNGRCNLTNWAAGPDHYHGDVALAGPLLKVCPPGRILEEFERLGLLCQGDEEGRVYPRNYQAAAVLQILRAGSQEVGVELRCGFGVTSIRKREGGFLLENREGQEIWCARCILACGGKASPRHSWEGGGYELARQLGHQVTKLHPSLTYLTYGEKPLRALKGMRCKARVTLWAGGEKRREDRGEVLFGDGSLSGICMFDMSAQLEQPVPPETWISLDLAEDMTYREVLGYLESQAKTHPQFPARELLEGMVNLRVGEELMKVLGVSQEETFRDLTRERLRKAAGLVKDWRFSITGTGSWENAQVTAGGVPLGEVDPLTLESRRCPGVYLTGELLNLHGDCGGYNLHWAWATGMAAGESAARKGRKEHNAC